MQVKALEKVVLSEVLGSVPILIPASRQDVSICVSATFRRHRDCTYKIRTHDSSIPTHSALTGQRLREGV